MMKCKCGGFLLVDDTDSRQEWFETYLHCEECEKSYTHRTDFDQNGLVVSDTLKEE